MFQPGLVTPTNLGSVAIGTNYISSPPAPPDSTVFLDHYFPSFILLPSQTAAVNCFTPLSICTCSPPPLPVQISAHLDFSITCHPPASAARLCAPHCVPASFAVSFDCAPPPPFPPLIWAHVPVAPWVVIPSRVTLHHLCPRLALSELSSKSTHLLVLGFLLGGFSREGDKPGRQKLFLVKLFW